MQTELLAEYAAIEEEAKKIEELRVRLRSQILSAMQLEKTAKLESPYGNFTVARKLSWKYSGAVSKLEEKLKITKFKEQEKGLAKAEETTYLLFKKPQDEE